MKNMAVNRWSGLALSLFAVAATACQQLPSFAFAADADQAGHVDDGAVFTADGPLAVLIGKNAEGKPLMDVAVPPGVDGSLITPRTGEMLERAMLPVSKIVPQLARPDYLPKAGAAQNNNNGDDNVAATLDQRIKELQAILKDKPKDRAASTELLQLYLVNKDDPASALPLLESGADLKARIHLPLAAKTIEDLKENELLDLAIWYQEIGNRTKSEAGIKMLARSYRYYESFLKLHTAADIQNATAKIALMKVHEAMQARAAGAAKPIGPSLHVQRTYARARAAWREGQPHVAINLLEAANSLAPNQPEILRLMSQLYFGELRNAVQGAHYTKQVLALNPTDLDSLFLLGRYEFLHLRQWNNAIVVFAHALTIEDKAGDSAIPMLTHHYLGRALQNEGYDAASIAEFEKFLDAAAQMNRPSRYMQEVGLFTRTLPIAWIQVGDAHNRLNNPQAALIAYEEANKLDPDDRTELANRIAYTQLRLGRGTQALKAILALVKETRGDKTSLALLEYLISAGVSAKDLTDEMRKLSDELGQPSALVLALANMQDGSDGLKTLRDHLLNKPMDREVFQAWLEKTFASTAATAAGDAVMLTAELIAKEPSTIDRYGDLLLDAAKEPAKILTAIESLAAAEKSKGIVRLLKAMALLRAGNDDAAIDEYAAAAQADPSLVSAQASLVKLLVDRREYERASKALATIKASDDPRILPLRVRVLRETNKTVEALALLEGLTAQQKRNPDMVLEKAKLQLISGDFTGATNTLEAGLDANPNAEPLYEAMLDLLDEEDTPEAQRLMLRISERMFRQIPRSKIAQVRKAQLFIRNRDIDSAERTLRDLQKDHPTDARSLALLTQILFFTERKDGADELVLSRLKAYQASEEVAAVAIQLVRLHLQSGDPSRCMAIITATLNNRAAVRDPRPLAMLARFAMVRAKKFDGMDVFYKKITSDYPTHWADLMSDWALTHEYAGEKPKSEAILEKILEKEPKHAKTNNALGYSWADQGKNLERAEKMIEIALKEDPHSSAYLDSMGWVKYKLGKFDEAVKYLEDAASQEGGDHAVILDHLGDALYRAGRKNDALDWWTKAQQSIDPQELDLDLELAKTSAALREKIAAMRASKEPATAEVPPKVEKKD